MSATLNCPNCGHPWAGCLCSCPAKRSNGRAEFDAAYTPAPVRTLQPGDVTQEGLTVLRVTPEVGGRLHVRFEDDDTLWRMHRDSIVWIVRANDATE